MNALRKHSIATLLTLFTLATASTLAFAASHGGDNKKAQKDAAEYRQSTYHMVGHHFGVMGDMVKGKTEFDKELFSKNADALAALTLLAPFGFEVEGLEGKTRAKQEIWENKADFDEKMKAFQTGAAALAEAAKGDDMDATKAAFGDAGKTCKGCHTDYRGKK